MSPIPVAHASMTSTPTFLNPPIVEFVLGAQFSPLTKLSSAHLGRFWTELGDEWINPRDNPLISEQFERFEEATPLRRRLQLSLQQAPLVNRLTLIHRDNDRLLQIQPTRLHLNWRKTDEFKPSYKELISEFRAMFERFVQFCECQELAPVEVNQWEVTYVDCFKKGEYWETPNEWGNFLPGLFGVKSLNVVEPLRLESRAAEWSFEIQPQLGRLHLSASMGQWKTEEPALMLNVTARGPLRPEYTDTLWDGLDVGHRIAVEQFLAIVAPETQKTWGRKDG